MTKRKNKDYSVKFDGIKKRTMTSAKSVNAAVCKALRKQGIPPGVGSGDNLEFRVFVQAPGGVEKEYIVTKSKVTHYNTKLKR